MATMYPNLAAEIAKRGIKKKAICESLGVTYRCLHNKMSGQSPITWEEACKIQSEFFPDIAKDILFESNKHAC